MPDKVTTFSWLCEFAHAIETIPIFREHWHARAWMYALVGRGGRASCLQYTFVTTQGPISRTIGFIVNSLYSIIFTKIFTCHDSTAVVPYAEFHSDHHNLDESKWIFNRIWITMKYTPLYYPILTPKKHKRRETWYIHSIRNMNCCSDETCLSQELNLMIQNYI